jgi:PAS domain S-box-containing protein
MSRESIEGFTVSNDGLLSTLDTLIMEEEQEGMFKELVENSSDIIIVTDGEYNIRYISSSVRSIFGLEPVSLVGRNIFDFIRAGRKDVWLKSLEDHDHFNGEETIKVDNEILYFDVNVSNLLNHYKVQGLVLKLHDITEKKKRENELMRSNKQLDQIIFKTIHDLKAPLMSAIGLVNLAERSENEYQAMYMKLIRKSLLNLNSFIEKMNDFFRNDKMEVRREKIDLRDIVESELSNLKTSRMKMEFPLRLKYTMGPNFIQILSELKPSSPIFFQMRLNITTL